jgi:pilus assembly protein Flp/PilA
LRKLFARLIEDESGATAIEYGLIISLMVVVILSALTAFGNASTNVFNTALEKLVDAIGG